jgi:hypothetical protein
MYEIPIEHGKIREFARAINADPASYDAPDAVVPPTFLTTASFFWNPAADALSTELGFDMTRILHGEESYRYLGPPPRAGQRLTVSARIEDRHERQGSRGGTMRLATVVHDFRDASGELVAQQRSTFIETGAAPVPS